MLRAGHSTRNSLFLNTARNGECASTFKRLPASADLINSSALAERFVKESARQSSLRACARSSVHYCFPFATSCFLLLLLLLSCQCLHRLDSVRPQFHLSCPTEGKLMKRVTTHESVQIFGNSCGLVVGVILWVSHSVREPPRVRRAFSKTLLRQEASGFPAEWPQPHNE